MWLANHQEEVIPIKTLILSMLIGSHLCINREFQCVSFNLQTCTEPGNGCYKTETCSKGVNTCFSAYRYDNGRARAVRGGCYNSLSIVDHCETTNCPGILTEVIEKPFYFCCCHGNLCNGNFTSSGSPSRHVTVSRPHSTADGTNKKVVQINRVYTERVTRESAVENNFASWLILTVPTSLTLFILIVALIFYMRMRVPKQHAANKIDLSTAVPV